jgi:hypothetical protein
MLQQGGYYLGTVAETPIISVYTGAFDTFLG